MSLHGPAGACIPVASGPLIHVPPVQRQNVYLRIVLHTNMYNKNIHVGIQNNLRIGGGIKKTVANKAMLQINVAHFNNNIVILVLTMNVAIQLLSLLCTLL